VPREQRAAFGKLRDFDESTFQKLLAAMREVQDLQPADIEKTLQDHGIVDDIRALAVMLRSIYIARSFADISIEEFANNAVRSLSSVDPKFKNDAFRGRLVELFNNEALRKRAKAVALKSDPVSYTHLTLPTICSV